MSRLRSARLPAVVSFLSEITIVTISIYLPLRAYQLGAGSFIVGLVGGSGSLVYIFAPFFMGRLSDRVGSRRLVGAGTAVIAVLCYSYTTVSAPELFIPLRIVEGVAWGAVWAPLEALYSVSGRDTFASLKTFNVSWGLGAVLAPLLGVAIVSWGGIPRALLVSSVAMALALAASLGIRGGKARPSPSAGARDLRATAALLPFAVMYGATTSTISTFFPRYAVTLGFSQLWWGAIISALLAGRLAAFFYSERMRAAVGAHGMQTGFTAAALAFPVLSILYPHGIYPMIAASFATGFFMGVVYSGTLNLMLAGPEGSRGSSAGLFESSLGLGTFAGPALAGIAASSGLWVTMAVPVASMLLALAFRAGLGGRR
ncbi:MAG: MFS transporter [Nitrososphaerota archaeon]|nr:MFS transporter [Nitrososphaerota archaeon]